MLKYIISPLKWSHVYVPVLPKMMGIDLLQCPTPFYVGLLREVVDTADFSIPEDVLLVDLDLDTCSVSEQLAAALPAGRRLARSLDKLFRPTLHRCDEPLVVCNFQAVSSALSTGQNITREFLRY